MVGEVLHDSVNQLAQAAEAAGQAVKQTHDSGCAGTRQD